MPAGATQMTKQTPAPAGETTDAHRWARIRFEHDRLRTARKQPLDRSYDPHTQIVAHDQQNRHDDDRDQHDDERQLDQARAGSLVTHCVNCPLSAQHEEPRWILLDCNTAWLLQYNRAHTLPQGGPNDSTNTPARTAE